MLFRPGFGLLAWRPAVIIFPVPVFFRDGRGSPAVRLLFGFASGAGSDVRLTLKCVSALGFGFSPAFGCTDLFSFRTFVWAVFSAAFRVIFCGLPVVWGLN